MGKQFDSDRETVAADSFAAGVGFIVTGTDLKSDRAAVDYLKKSRFEHAWCTCGIHPHNADRWDENYKKQLLELIQRNRGIVAAVGEVGLDYDRMFSTKENQKRCFSDILDIAESLELPLFLHERSAEQDFIKLMKQHQELCRRSVVHLLMCDKEAIEVQKILPFLSDTWPLCRIGRAVIRASQSCRQSCNKSQCPACGCRSHHSCTHAPQFSRSFPAREWGAVLQRQGACGQCP